jgi:hypothetical protein
MAMMQLELCNIEFGYNSLLVSTETTPAKPCTVLKI